MKIKNLLAISLMSFSLAACNTDSIIPIAPKSPSQAVYLAEGEYLVAVKIAAKYNTELKDCSLPDAPKVCRSQAVVDVLRLSQKSARATLDAAEGTVRNPAFGSSALSSAVIAAEGAVKAFKDLTATLGVE